MIRFSIFSLVAGILEISIVLPQLYRTFKTKKVENISVLTWILFICGNTLWLLYGVLTYDTMVVIVNSFNIAKNSLMLLMIYVYSSRNRYVK